MQIKPLPPKIKKTIEMLIGLVNISLPAFVFLERFSTLPDDYSDIRTLLPTHPVSSILSIVMPFLIVLALFWYFYKKKEQIGHLKTLGVVLMAWTLLISIQSLLTYYTFNFK